jgi:hypothetical protein
MQWVNHVRETLLALKIMPKTSESLVCSDNYWTEQLVYLINNKRPHDPDTATQTSEYHLSFLAGIQSPAWRCLVVVVHRAQDTLQCAGYGRAHERYKT